MGENYQKHLNGGKHLKNMQRIKEISFRRKIGDGSLRTGMENDEKPSQYAERIKQFHMTRATRQFTETAHPHPKDRSRQSTEHRHHPERARPGHRKGPNGHADAHRIRHRARPLALRALPLPRPLAPPRAGHPTEGRGLGRPSRCSTGGRQTGDPGQGGRHPSLNRHPFRARRSTFPSTSAKNMEYSSAKCEIKRPRRWKFCRLTSPQKTIKKGQLLFKNSDVSPVIWLFHPKRLFASISQECPTCE